jgi:predicted nucleotidyltransferase
MGVDETLLNEIVRRVLSVAHPDRIILFGSAAAGQMTKDSDIDLLVVEPALANTHERQVEIRDAVGDIGYPVDVIVMRTERFERTKRFIGGIAYPANKYGRVIYEAARFGPRVPPAPVECGEGFAGRLSAIGRDCAPRLKEPFRSTPHGDLLYDELGLPR